MDDRRPRRGEIYRHFKGQMYRVVGIAKHSETNDELVIYHAVNDELSLYARPMDMFTGPVDRNKYPDVAQDYRFERVDAVSREKACTYVQDKDVNPDLIAFLEADTYKEKRNIFKRLGKNVNDRLIDDIAASLDVVIKEGDIAARYEDLMKCLDTMVKFECQRLR